MLVDDLCLPDVDGAPNGGGGGNGGNSSGGATEQGGGGGPSGSGGAAGGTGGRLSSIDGGMHAGDSGAGGASNDLDAGADSSFADADGVVPDGTSPNLDARDSEDGTVSTDGAIGAEAGSFDAGEPDASDPIPPGIIVDDLACGSRDVTGGTQVSGIITEDTTWSGIVHITSDVSVRNEATLTIESGTKVIVGLDASIEFGWQGSQPTLRALGTEAAPIRICGEVETPGYWQTLHLLPSVKSESVLRNVLIADGGGSTSAALHLEAPITVQGLQVRGAAGIGVQTPGFADESDVVIVKGAGSVPVALSAIAGAELVPHVDLTGNAVDAVWLLFNRIDSSARFRDLGVPYQQQRFTVSMAPGAEDLMVEFGPGTVYESPYGYTLNFGDATARVVGTSEKPVVFRGPACTASSTNCPDGEHERGGGITVEAGSSNSLFVHAELRYLVGLGALTTAAEDPVTLKNVSFLGSSALRFVGASGGLSPDSDAISIQAAGVQAIQMESSTCAELFTIPESTTIAEGGRLLIDCDEVAVDGTVRKRDAPYLIRNGMVIRAALAVDPGVTFELRLANTVRVEPDGALYVNGTSTSRVRFVPVDMSPGNAWAFIRVDSPHVEIRYAEIRGGGYPALIPGFDQASIHAIQPFLLENSIVADSAYYGLLKDPNDTTDYSVSNTFENNASGDIADF